MRDSDLAGVSGFISINAGFINPVFFTIGAIFFAAALICRAIERTTEK